MIKVEDLTLTYPSGKGIFNVDFTVKTGGITGYLGPNGSGKTTTIRALMGFMRPDSGICSINGMDCRTKATQIQNILGYIPGEISFFDQMEGDEFLNFMSDMRRTKNERRKNDLIELLDLNPKGKIKKFSKGMKQKLGIVAAFMHDPEILVLDEPTSGLDPLMQNVFIDLVMEEKKRGKTILMSSHMFEEVERTCDDIIIIKEGKIVTESDVGALKKALRKSYLIRPKNMDVGWDIMQNKGFEATKFAPDIIEAYIGGDDVDRFIKAVAGFEVESLDVRHQSLEDLFLEFYSKGGN
ncbi:ABC transporter ATP-binding protein [Alkalibacter saccharofermentans]|uniref:ABC-2 type transport system ATP-binding protein n=1 Tax=Alkalibacter saccharofermentans DSM 14828 TaxID=1120975 RepID=A0A1M4ZT01_9FIRM|nr:ABC transporter ATP-binding protein [Alkalibacter saccharofermentans]SHF20892.1 ABC-2 type transport system ATP-binding protein [Alkalibacter saccharofermentans DSM 14828]